mmetsp:Transcript_48111/g.148499  ORF Transcript_48111/g.148499 Transcript_48111/m.148499 type:complete len:85 (-) Transcript_48111:3-257(-)
MCRSLPCSLQANLQSQRCSKTAARSRCCLECDDTHAFFHRVVCIAVFTDRCGAAHYVCKHALRDLLAVVALLDVIDGLPKSDMD